MIGLPLPSVAHSATTEDRCSTSSGWSFSNGSRRKVFSYDRLARNYLASVCSSPLLLYGGFNESRP